MYEGRTDGKQEGVKLYFSVIVKYSFISYYTCISQVYYLTDFTDFCLLKINLWVLVNKREKGVIEFECLI